MQRFLGRLEAPVYALARIIFGLLWACHGAQKLFGMFGRNQPVEWMSQLGAAGAIELIGGLCIAAGLFTTVVAFIASGEMAVAYFQAHAPRGAFPIQNGGELAVMYCWFFLFVCTHGSGMLSLDSLRGKGRR